MKEHNIQPSSVKKQLDMKVKKNPVYEQTIDPKLQLQMAKLK